jgi:hypothetical protein
LKLLKVINFKTDEVLKMKKEIIDIYSDYLICSFNYTTATGLSSALNQQISHDKITRFLAEEELNSKQLWLLGKPIIRQHECDDGVVIFDDTVIEKQFSQESELICYHFDHVKGRSVKGFNLLNCVYSTGDVTLPIGFDLVKKPYQFCELKTHKRKRKSAVTKNELLRNRLAVCQRNQLKYKYILTDSWFSSKENMSYIHKDLEKYFMMALKSNRTVALSEEDKKQGCFTRIDALEWTEHTPVLGWLKLKDWISPFYFTAKSLQTKTEAQAFCIWLAVI